jgi:molecular chaperone DnaK (HSP70)
MELGEGANHRTDVVLGVPASFREAGKKRLREAAKRGIIGESADRYDGIRLYYEPVAAARAYRNLDAGNTLVLDYGGGTLDISVNGSPGGGTVRSRQSDVRWLF